MKMTLGICYSPRDCYTIKNAYKQVYQKRNFKTY